MTPTPLDTPAGSTAAHSTIPTPFDSLPELAAAHAALVTEVGRDLLAPENLKRVTEFVRRAVGTGAVLEVQEDRAAAQDVIGFWTARVATAARTSARAARRSGSGDSGEPTPVPDFGDTLLVRYEPATLTAAVAAADKALEGLGDDDLVRRLFLRLVRLRPDKDVFDPVPATRAVLADLGSQDVVDRLIANLAGAGVLRVVSAECPAADQVTLRAAGLTTAWPRLARWLEGRRQFRSEAAAWKADRDRAASDNLPRFVERVDRWATHRLSKLGRSVEKRLTPAVTWVRRKSGLTTPSDRLVAGEQLEDARAYLDKTPDEKRFTDASLDQQQLKSEKIRILMAGFALMALAAAIGWGVAVNRAVLYQGQKDVAEAKAKALRDRQQFATLRTYVRYQGEVVGTRQYPDLAAEALARERLRIFTDAIENGGDLYAHLRDLRLAEGLSGGGPFRLDRDKLNAIRALRDKLTANDAGRQSLRQFRRVSYEMTRYSAKRIVSTLGKGRARRGAEPTLDDVQAYVQHFWAEYWGEMLLVESREVQQKMIAFGDALTTAVAEATQPDKDLRDALVKLFAQHGGVRGPELAAKAQEVAFTAQAINQLATEAPDLPVEALNHLLVQAMKHPVTAETVSLLETAYQELDDAIQADLDSTTDVVPAPPS
jgi:hypothetical protein